MFNSAQLSIESTFRKNIQWLATSMRQHPVATIFILAALVIRIIFWLWTQRVWEDALITITPVLNLFHGKGLTHHSGEPLTHSYTSALSVLIPMLGQIWNRPITALRLASLFSSVIAIIYAYRIAKRLSLGMLPIIFLLAYLAFDQQQIFFGMAGMETQVAVAVIMASIYYLLEDDDVKVGLLAGFALLARPDFIIWVAIAFITIGLRLRKIRYLARFGVCCSLIALPWILFTTFYYGSPIPNTIVAKNLYAHVGFNYSPNFHELVYYSAHWVLAFTPFYESTFVRHAPIPLFLLLGIAIVFISLSLFGFWVKRNNHAILAAGVFFLLFAMYRTRAMLPTYFSWYLPPFLAIMALFAAIGLDSLSQLRPRLSRVLTIGLIIAFTAHIPFSFPLEKRVQQDIENGVRTKVGWYLHDHMKPGESVVLEPVGYIGYFGGDHLYYDFPGLTSKRVVQLLKSVAPEHRDLNLLIDRLKPEWAVLRPGDIDFSNVVMPAALVPYMEVTRIVARPGLNLKYGGLEYYSIDTSFVIFKRVQKKLVHREIA